jgi:hypothetical protein
MYPFVANALSATTDQKAMAYLTRSTTRAHALPKGGVMGKWVLNACPCLYGRRRRLKNFGTEQFF